MSPELPTAYDPSGLEERWYEQWERDGRFKPRPNPDKKPFTVVIPPPNVTGALHIGHAFEHSLQDAFVRRARMQGFETLWLPGTDHAGIATQNVVERDLAKEGLSRHDLGREAFVQRVWEWKRRYGGRILEQMRRLGESCDWDRERFTMDEGLSRAVRTVFVRWFDDGFIYRGNRIINWCPSCMTALADIEVDHEDVAGEIITFQYPLAEGDRHISVATTRIETMLGDTGIAVHPDDPRYRDLIGKRVRHPFFPDREIPIVADEAVDREFGTGAVKVTPAHDPTDFEIGERHGLEKINIFDERASTTAAAGPFADLDRYDARKKVLESLKELGAVEKEERPYVHPVGHCYRSHTEVEPWLSEQWFLKMKELAEPAMEVVRNGRIRIEPKRFVKSYIDWMENIRDWCISRQLWWGHRIPVWYCDGCGKVWAALEDPGSCPDCDSKSIRQDPDVLDTWFSSQLWPFSTLGWPDETEDLAYFYPTTLMAPGYEILYLWVARMITSGLYFMGDVPFKEVLIHGIVRDFEGKKMSKSIGNVIDPLDMIARYGADAVRFALASGGIPGNDTNVSEDRIEGARNFANKLWNASRFVLISCEDRRPGVPPEASLRVEDRWILARLNAVTRETEASLDALNWAEALRVLHRFTWSEYCDWYIELAKLRLNTDGADAAGGVLLYVLDHILRLLHPVMPFVTEEIWSYLRPSGDSIMVADWPEDGGRPDAEAQDALQRFQDLVTALRRLRADHGIAPGVRMNVTISPGRFRGEVEEMSDALVALARLEAVDLTQSLAVEQHEARTITPAGIEASVALGDVIDLDVEAERLRRKLGEVEEDITRAERKLSNSDFISKAPAGIVDQERRKLEKAQANREKIEAQLRSVSG